MDALDGYSPAIGGSAGDPDETHGGRIERPVDMPTKAQCDFVVDNKADFIDAITTDHATVYVDGDFQCNILKTIWAGDDITIVSGHCDPERNENGGDGPTVHFDYFTETAIKSRSSITLYGVCFRGPEGDYFDPRERTAKNPNVESKEAYYAAGVWCLPDKGKGEFKAIGCKFYDWPHAAVQVGSKECETDALVSRCTFLDCRMETLGYGIQQYDGSLVAERCYFDRCRHAICGFGYPTETLVLAECVFGPGDWHGHVVDRHGLANNLPRIEAARAWIAGGWMHIYRCAFKSHTPGEPIQDAQVGDQEALSIRGASMGGSYVDKCDFWHAELPEPHGDQGDAIRQETELLDDADVADGWVNLDIRDNATGGNNGPEYGPALASDPDDDIEYDELRLIGYSKRPSSYRIVVNGDAKPVRQMEGNDRVVHKGDRTIISGHLIAGVDTLGIEKGAEIVEAWVSGTARVERNGSEVDLAGPTTAAMEQRLKTLTERVAALERTERTG